MFQLLSISQKALVSILFCCFSVSIYSQSSIDAKFKAIVSLNLGMHHYSGGLDRKSTPEFGNGIGIQVIKPYSQTIHAGFEIHVTKTKTLIENYYSYINGGSRGFDLLLFETTGDLRIDEFNVHVPLFIRFNVDGFNIDFGLEYKRLVSNSSSSNLVRAQWYPSTFGAISEEDRFEEPILTSADPIDFENNVNSYGYVFGMGRKVEFDHLVLNLGFRYVSHFEHFQNYPNPIFRNFEIRSEIGLK